jgi:hypothetical protein
MRRIALTLTVMLDLVLSLPAQTNSKGPAGGESATPPMQLQSNLLQLMRGVFYPASNVVFSAQTDNPGDVKRPPGKDPSMATDPLVSTFGGWQAVENASLALADSANLLTVPGLKCSNGLPAPMNNPDWARFVQELRDAGMKAYRAAQSKDQDKMIDVADTMTKACGGCHRKWREKPMADRCK